MSDGCKSILEKTHFGSFPSLRRSTSAFKCPRNASHHPSSQLVMSPQNRSWRPKPTRLIEITHNCSQDNVQILKAHERVVVTVTLCLHV